MKKGASESKLVWLIMGSEEGRAGERFREKAIRIRIRVGIVDAVVV